MYFFFFFFKLKNIFFFFFFFSSRRRHTRLTCDWSSDVCSSDLHFRVVGSVVMHDDEHRNLVMRGSPQHTRREVEIAISLDIDGEPAVLLVGQGSANGCWRVVADTARALAADVLVVLIEVPELVGPTTNEALPADERPVFILDQRPQLSCETGKTDGAGIPTEACVFFRLIPGALIRLCNFGGAILEESTAVCVDQFLALFDEEGQRGFGIRRD